MSKFYHFNPPKRENYRTEEEYEEALEEWEWAEDEYAEGKRPFRTLMLPWAEVFRHGED